MDAPKFTVNYDVVQAYQRDSYKNFIEKVVQQLQQNNLILRRIRDMSSVLLPESGAINWFHIELRNGSAAQTITLRIKASNLYTLAYRSSNNNTWFQLNGLNIPNAVTLPFSEVYGDKILEEMLIGREQLTGAVSFLSSTNSQSDMSLVEKWFKLLWVMISEATRFRSILTLTTKWLEDTDGKSGKLDTVSLKRIHCWSDLSAEVLKCEAIGGRLFDPDNKLPKDAINIHSFEEAINELRVLKYFKVSPTKVSPLQFVRQLLAGVGEAELYEEGQILLEVFDVVLNTPNNNNAEIYGTISVTDGLGCQYIYNCSSEIDKYLQHLGNESSPSCISLRLSGPTRPISAYGHFSISFDLISKGKTKEMEVEGTFNWSSFASNIEYDAPMSAEIIPTGNTNNHMLINYAVVTNAVPATVKLELLSGDYCIYGKVDNTINIHGIVYARTYLGSVLLFHRSPAEASTVKVGEPIPLDRSIVVVPLGCHVTIDATLFYDNDKLANKDTSTQLVQIVNDSAKFDAQGSGTSGNNLQGEGSNGQVKVNIEWNVYN